MARPPLTGKLAMIIFAKVKRFGLVDNEQWDLMGNTTAHRKAAARRTLSTHHSWDNIPCPQYSVCIYVNLKLFISQLLCKSNSLHTDIKRKKEISGDSCVENFHRHDDWCTFSS
jgi:hypothetical protein